MSTSHQLARSLALTPGRETSQHSRPAASQTSNFSHLLRQEHIFSAGHISTESMQAMTHLAV